MLRRILKYPIAYDGPSPVVMPRGARILSAVWQDSGLVVWAMVDEAAPKVLRRFEAGMTGAMLRDFEAMEFVGTAQRDIPDSPHMPHFVVHVFVEPEA